MCPEAHRGVCMLDRAGLPKNDLFRFSRTKMQWEQLDAPQVLGSSPSGRYGHGMVAVESDLYVFGGIVESFEGYRLINNFITKKTEIFV
jgi:hypothetical protein